MLLDVQRATACSNHNQHANSFVEAVEASSHPSQLTPWG